MLYPIVLRCAAPSDLAAIGELDPAMDAAALGQAIEAGRYFVAQHRDRLVAGAGWTPGGGPPEIQVRLTFADPTLGDGEVVERLLWYAQTAALFAGMRAEAAAPPAAQRASLAVVVADAALARGGHPLAA